MESGAAVLLALTGRGLPGRGCQGAVLECRSHTQGPDPCRQPASQLGSCSREAEPGLGLPCLVPGRFSASVPALRAAARMGRWNKAKKTPPISRGSPPKSSSGQGVRQGQARERAREGRAQPGPPGAALWVCRQRWAPRQNPTPAWLSPERQVPIRSPCSHRKLTTPAGAQCPLAPVAGPCAAPGPGPHSVPFSWLPRPLTCPADPAAPRPAARGTALRCGCSGRSRRPLCSKHP